MSPYLVLLILDFFPARLATLPYGLYSNVTQLRANLLTKPSVFYYLPIVSCSLVSIKLLLLCRAYAGPHDIVYNTTKTVCMLVRPKQSQGGSSTRVRLGNEELSFVEEFRYLGNIMTADCGDDKDIKKQFRRQNAVGNMLVRKFSLHLLRQKSNCSSRIVTPFMDVHFGVIHSRTLLENLLSVIVTHSSVLLTSQDAPAQVWHLRWTQLTITMWCYANLPTAWWAE